MHKKGVCSQGKVNSGDDTQKAYRDINNIDGIFALSARKYHYIAINGRQIYEYDTKVRKRTGNNEIKAEASLIASKRQINSSQERYMTAITYLTKATRYGIICNNN